MTVGIIRNLENFFDPRVRGDGNLALQCPVTLSEAERRLE